MKELKADFITSSTELSQMPTHSYPEIAFAGRSNVGKSSLINSIVLRKNLARTSATPGKTQQINFFLVEEKWVLADMPGFGYAASSKVERAKWTKLNFSYLEKRDALKMVCVLIDSRHDPQDHDLALIEFLEQHGKDYLIILTKCDKISSKSVIERKEQVEAFVAQCNHCREVLPYSTVKGLGRSEFVGILKKIIAK